jgi:ABC-2 type transport system permease protein
MKDQIRSEYRKLRTTRSVWGLLAGLAALTALATWGIIAHTSLGASAALTSLPVIVPLMMVVPIFTLVLGVRAYTDEARHGSIVPTLLASPDRRRVIGAKLVVAGAAGAVLALASVAVALGISVAWLAADGVAITVAAGSLGLLVAKVAVLGALWSSIGLGVGLFVSHQVAAIVGSLVWLLVGENLVEVVSAGMARFLPVHAGTGLLGISSGDATLVGPLVGAGLLAGWALLSLGAGARAFLRRDI